MTRALLIVGGADDCDDDAENNTEDQRRGSHPKCGQHAVEILLPAVIFDKRLIEIDI